MSASSSPQRGRFVAWAGFVFGSVSSVAANVLHTWLPAAHMPAGWTPGIAPQIGAAVWPIGLLLSVEVLSRVRWQSGWLWALARYGGAGAVAVGSAIISYSHLRDVLVTWGYGHLAAGVGPVALDGLMVVCGFALLSMTLARETSTTPEPVEVSPEPPEPVAPVALEVATPDDRLVGPVWTPRARRDEVTTAQVATEVTETPAPSVRLAIGPSTDPGEDTGADTRRQTARELSGDGWTHAEIAAHLGVSKRTVRRYLSAPSGEAIGAPDTETEHGPVQETSLLELPAPAAAVEGNHHQSFEGVLA
ncbi:helix-turn-helix domain-containing protein [Nocardia macrotermitis]|uniref:Uncharacterized protein n=1 Tax=Nocardia macrotermitis TaxID=2585198 RepID=A0A7K0DA79_9NOCA|nr:sigma-70 region 4 domain-containing protein [Nocardia macrotermitis]MQY22680.1 hypothetical protein [Nocardia macrotermitis]